MQRGRRSPDDSGAGAPDLRRPAAAAARGLSRRPTLPRSLARAALLVIGLSSTWARADFQTPTRISSGESPAGRFDLGLDYFENLNLAYEEERNLVVEIRGNGLQDQALLGAGREPSLAFDSIRTFVAFSRPHPGAGGENAIFLASRVGSQWSRVQEASAGGGDHRFPHVELAGDRSPVLAWEKRQEGGPSIVCFRRPGVPPMELGRGERPALALDASDRAHLFFLRDGDIFHAREESSVRPGVFLEPENITQTPFATESAPRADTVDGRVIFLCFAREGEVFFGSNRTGSFASPLRVATDGADHPAMVVSASGTVGIAYERQGDIHSILGTTFFLPPPTRVTSTAEPESEPAVAVDSFANLFVAFKKEGALYYVTNAGPPQASFDADPLRGEAPLEVQFTDKSIGAVTGWFWDFGDGATSRERSPRHTFTSSGEYVVGLGVTGPGGESPLADRKSVLVLDPRNEMRIADVSAFPGQRQVHIPVLATHDRPAAGFTVAATYDPNLVEITGVEVTDTNLAEYSPELFAVDISEDRDDPYVTVGILLDVVSPFDGRTVPPGVDQRIAGLLANVKPGAPPGSTTRVELKNQLGRPPLNNIFTVMGFTVLPVLAEGGLISIRRLTFPIPRFFRRGDSDGNGTVNLTDAITTLNFLFTGGPRPQCLDATDITDDGHVDVSDPTFTFNFLFRGGRYPPPPFPDYGLDPTEDLLPPCTLR